MLSEQNWQGCRNRNALHHSTEYQACQCQPILVSGVPRYRNATCQGRDLCGCLYSSTFAKASYHLLCISRITLVIRCRCVVLWRFVILPWPKGCCTCTRCDIDIMCHELSLSKRDALQTTGLIYGQIEFLVAFRVKITISTTMMPPRREKANGTSRWL